MNMATVGTSRMKAPERGLDRRSFWSDFFVSVVVRAKPYDDIDVGDDFVLPEGRVWLHF